MATPSRFNQYVRVPYRFLVHVDFVLKVQSNVTFMVLNLHLKDSEVLQSYCTKTLLQILQTGSFPECLFDEVENVVFMI